MVDERTEEKMSLPTEMLRENILEEVAVYLVCFLFFFLAGKICFGSNCSWKPGEACRREPACVSVLGSRATEVNGLEGAFGAQVWCFKCI